MDPLTQFPATLRQGDTLKILSSLDFQNDVWTLTWYFSGPTTEAQQEAEASGSDFLLTLDPEFTGALGVETLGYVAKVQNEDGEVYTVISGTVEVLADLATIGTSDQRSHAQKTLDALRAVIEGRATADESEYTIKDRSLKRMSMDELLKFLAVYEKKVALETRVGQKNIVVEFARPS